MRNEFWIISTLISIGVIGGFIYNWPSSTNPIDGQGNRPKDPLTPIPQGPVEVVSAEDLPQRLDELRRQGDKYLDVGNFDDAMERYAILLNLHEKIHNEPTNDHTLLFRIALASEMMGQFDRADYFYRFGLSLQLNFFQRLAMQLAYARNLAKFGQPDQAVDLLSELYLQHQGNESLEEQIKFDIGYQLLQQIQFDAQSLLARKVPLLDQPLLEQCPIDIQRSLALIHHGSGTGAKPFEIGAEDQLEVLQNPTGRAELIIVEGKYKSTAINKLFTDISRIANLQFDINADVQPYLVGRTVKFDFPPGSLAVLLDVILHPLNLTWQQTDTTIKLIPAPQSTELAEFRAKQAVRLGRYLVVNYPNQPCVESIRLANAGMSQLIGEFDDASTILNQLLDKKLGGELKAKAYLNIGLIEKQFLRYDNAIEFLLGAADQSLNRDIQAIAYANMAQIHLDRGHIDPAIIASGRALALTKNLKIRGSAALDIAKAYMINREPQSANQALFDHRAAFTDGVDLKIAQVMGAYARYLGTLNQTAKETAIETLVLALADIDPAEIRHSAGRIIVAQAYTSIGLPNQAIETLLITNAKHESVIWERTRTFELANLLMQYGTKQAAISNYQKLARDLSDEIGKRSLIKLAQYRLNGQNDPDGCLELCHRLWQDGEEENAELTETIKTVTLRLMGQAYTQKGDYEAAGNCFWGRLPAVSINTTEGVSN